jgi:hypothetical protein
MTTATTSAPTARYGKFTVDGTDVARSKNHVVNPKLASKSEWGDSDSAGYTVRQPGRKDCTFTVDGTFDSTTEQYDAFQPGDKVQATLWMTQALYWDFPCAMNDDFSLTINRDTEEVMGWSGAFGTDGIYYYPGQSGAAARTY